MSFYACFPPLSLNPRGNHCVGVELFYVCSPSHCLFTLCFSSVFLPLIICFRSSASASDPMAFAEIMAASSSTSRRGMQYDVFINHRCPDTKQTLASSIYHALKPLGVQVFLDEPELEFGDSIPSELQYAINTSFLNIAILSPTYEESTWCLEELSLMLKSGHTIVPVFYNSDVNDVRWVKGRFAEEFSKLEGKNRYSPEKVEDWKSALQRVSYLKATLSTVAKASTPLVDDNDEVQGSSAHEIDVIDGCILSKDQDVLEVVNVGEDDKIGVDDIYMEDHSQHFFGN